MKMKIFSVVVTAIILLAGSVSFAAPLLTNGTLTDFIALGSTGGQIDDKLFSNFSYVGTALNAPVISADQITVTVVNTPSNPGVIFSAPWSVSSGQLQVSDIQFDVQVLPGGSPIDFILAVLNPISTGTGIVAPTLSANTTFPALGPFLVDLNLVLEGGTDGTASLSSVSINFHESAVAVPEPSTILLLGSGLIGLAGCGRKKFLKK